MKTATPTDTCDLIMGSGATTYSWYEDIRDTHLYEAGGAGEAFDDWHCTLIMENPEEDGHLPVTVNHKEVMKWARHVIANKGKRLLYGKQGIWRVQVPLNTDRRAWSTTLESECRNLIFDVDECDFDADSADELLQLIAYGEVVFG